MTLNQLSNWYWRGEWRKDWRKRVAATFLATLLAACGGSTIQTVLNGSGPLLNFLVKNGKISQAKADALKIDFADAGKCAAELDDALDQISKDDPQAKAKKRNAWLTAANFCWKPIVLRQNFAADSKIQTIASILDGIFMSGVLFHAPPRDGVERAPVDEKVLEQAIDERVKQLKAAMKVPQ